MAKKAKNEKEKNVISDDVNNQEDTNLKKEEVKASTATTQKSSKETSKKAKKKNGYFKEFKAELKKVVWPTPKEVINGTTAVIMIVLITTLIVFILDFCFEKLNSYGINKLRSIVSSETEAENTTIDLNDIVENVVIENTVTDTNTVQE